MRDRSVHVLNQSRAANTVAALSWAWLRFAVTAAFDLVLVWHQRSVERHRLKSLNDHMLRDIGISRFEVEAECRKPFWKA